MRDFAQPKVLKAAAVAGLGTALACYPRLALWPDRSRAIWFLELAVFLSATVLWGFVFAWHTKYASRPVFTLKLEPKLWGMVTIIAVFTAVLLYRFLDPALRLQTPEDYPGSVSEWIAMVLFTLGMSQLFLLFAPFAWLVRLFRDRRVAAVLTVLFGVVVLVVKTQSSPTPFPLPLFWALVFVRIVIGSLSVFFYLRGGVWLVWWWGVVLESRHLLSLIAP